MAHSDARQTRGDDSIGRFVAAVESSPEFRRTLDSDDRDKIAEALKQHHIDLAPAQREQFINACVSLHKSGGWVPMDNIRNSLMMPPGAGVMG